MHKTLSAYILSIGVEIEPPTLTAPVNTRLTAELKDPLPIEIILSYTILQDTRVVLVFTLRTQVFTLPVFLTCRFAEHKVWSR